MAAVTQVNMIYLGNAPQVDTDERDLDAEFPHELLGTYDNSDMDIVRVTQYDIDRDTLIDDDETGTGDYVSYFSTTGEYIEVQPDSSMAYNAVVTLGDGSTRTGVIQVVQFTNGDYFAADFNGGMPLDNLKIQSIELTSVDSTHYRGYNFNANVSNSEIVCFVSGTLIATPTGERPVEALRAGDAVLTADRGSRTVLWSGLSRLTAPGRHAPICIAAGTLGPGLPARDLLVSRQHRVLVRSTIAERMFGAAEVLVAAHRLTPLPGIEQLTGAEAVIYYHLLFDGHELIRSEGAWTESLFNGSAARSVIPPRDQASLSRILERDWTSVRPIPEGRRQRKLVERHLRNARPLVEAPDHAVA